MDISKVEQKSLIYAAVRVYMDFWHNKIFYNKVELQGIEKVDFSKPRLIAPNHQNALMDAMAVLCNLKDQPVFVARADIFSNPLIIRFLIFIKILPIYRIRDGKDKLALNERIFEKSVDILEKKKTLIVFPEAAHTNTRTLLPLKKGLFRIAFAAEEKHHFSLDAVIYPVGIVYNKYDTYKSNLFLNYGTPIDMAAYKVAYAENPQKTLMDVRHDLTLELEKIAIHIKNKEHYQFYELAREIFDYQTKEYLNTTNENSLKAKFNADKSIIETLDKEFEQNPDSIKNLDLETQLYTKKLKRWKLKDWIFDKNISKPLLVLKSLLGLLLFPFFATGVLHYALPFFLPELLVPKFKDKQFHSSIRFVLSLLLVHFWVLLIFSLLWIFTDVWWIKWLYLIIQAPFTQFLFWYRKQLPKVWAQWRFIFNIKSLASLRIERQKLTDAFALLYDKHQQEN